MVYSSNISNSNFLTLTKLSRSLFGKSKKKRRQIKQSDDEGESSDGWIDDEGVDDSDANDENKNIDGSKKVRDEVLRVTYPPEDIKMILVVRDDLKMGKGKIGA